MSYYKVVYDKLFPYAPYLNERIGIEILIEHGQDPLEALEDAWQKVHDFRNKHIQAELSHQYEPATEPIPDIQPVKTTMQEYIEIINNCKFMDDLEDFKVLANTYPELKKAYDNKLKTVIK